MAKETKEDLPESLDMMREILGDYIRQDAAYTHVSLADAAKDLPMKLANERAKNVPHSAWELLEHIHITQHDMLDFIRNPNYEEMEWPKDYWPVPGAKADRETWNLTLQGYAQDVVALHDIAKDTSIDLLAPIPHGTGGQTIFREIIQAIDHTSYHVGELVLLRRTLGAWGEKGK